MVCILYDRRLEKIMYIFFELPPDLKISDLIRMLKSTTSKWINDNHLFKSKFNWQSGYGAFSIRDHNEIMWYNI